MTAVYLRVKNWKEWQHYKDREPPWVKLHSKLLRDSGFLELGEVQQWQLVRIWMVAAQSSRFTLDEKGRVVPVVVKDESAIRRATASLKKVPLALFIEQGWLIPVEEEQLVENPHGDSTALAPGLHGASTLLVTEEQRVRGLEKDPKAVVVPVADPVDNRTAPDGKRLKNITPTLREIA